MTNAVYEKVMEVREKKEKKEKDERRKKKKKESSRWFEHLLRCQCSCTVLLYK